MADREFIGWLGRLFGEMLRLLRGHDPHATLTIQEQDDDEEAV